MSRGAHTKGTNTRAVSAIAFSPDGARIASGATDGTILVWNVATRTSLSMVKQGDRVNAIAFSPDSTRLAVASIEQALRIWTVSSRRLAIELDAHASRARAVAFSPAGDCLTGSDDGTIRMWDSRTGKLIGSPPGARECSGVSASFSPDGKSLVYGAESGCIVIWDLFA